MKSQPVRQRSLPRYAGPLTAALLTSSLAMAQDALPVPPPPVTPASPASTPATTPAPTPVPPPPAPAATASEFPPIPVPTTSAPTNTMVTEPAKPAAPAKPAPAKKPSNDFFDILDLKEGDINRTKTPPKSVTIPNVPPSAEMPLPTPSPTPTSGSSIMTDAAALLNNTPPTGPTGGPAIPGAPATPVQIDPTLERERAKRIQEADRLAAKSMDDLSPHRISIVEAVRLTLSSNPNIQLSVEDVKEAEASLLSIQGNFDWKLSGEAKYENKVQELTDRDKTKERERYKAIKELYKTSEVILDRIAAVKSGKMSPDEFDYEGTPLEDPQSYLSGGPVDDRLQEEQAGAYVDVSKSLASDQLNELIKILKENANPGQVKEIDRLAVRAIASQRDLWRKVRRSALKTLREQPPWIVRRTESTTYNLTLNRMFRGGIGVEVFANYTGREDNFSKRGSLPRENRTSVGIQVDVNLTKTGLGDLATAQELAQMQDLNARREMARDRAAQQVLETVQAYWQLSAAQERLARLYLSELETLASTALAKEMIEGGVLPGVEMAQVNARELQAVAARFGAEIELATAEQALALSMGFDPERAHLAPLAADPLPPYSDNSDLQALPPSMLLRHTLMYHPALVAFRYTGNASAILEEQARRDMRPDFNVYVGGDFSGYNQTSGWEGTAGVWGSNHTGPSVVAGLSFEWPFENREREGAYYSAMSQSSRNRLQENDARRRLATQVALAQRKVLLSVIQGAKLSAATKAYGEALNGERQKLRGGTSTVVDVLTTEQNLTQAMLQEVSAKLLHATSLAEMRYTSFTLLPPFEYELLEDGINRLRITDEFFTVVPSPLALGRYRGTATSVASATGALDGLPIGGGTGKPKPLLNRIFGSKDDKLAPISSTPVYTEKQPVEPNLRERLAQKPATPPPGNRSVLYMSRPAERAPEHADDTPSSIPSEAPPAATPAPKKTTTRAAAPAAPAKSDSSPKPLLKRIW